MRRWTTMYNELDADFPARLRSDLVLMVLQDCEKKGG